MTSVLFIDRMPLWLLFLVSSGFVLAVWELGCRLGAARRRAGEDVEPFASEMITAVLGLLAFLLAFTFSLASTRYQARQDLAVEEVKALRRVYLTATLIDEPDRTALRTALRRYVLARLDSLDTQAQFERMLDSSNVVEQDLVAIAAHVARSASEPSVRANVVEHIDDLVVLNYLRVEVGERSRTPSSVIVTLYIVVGVVLLVIGWHAGERGTRRRHALRALAISFGVVMALISVLDRAQNALVHENQRLMVPLKAWIDSQPTS